MIITELWRRQPGKFFCLASKNAQGKFREHFFHRGAWDEVRKFVRDNADKDIYFCPHGFTQAIRQKKYAELPTMLWADLDEISPRDIDPKPTIAIESSPGRYVGLWLTDATIDEDTNRRLTYMIGADKGGWDLTQVLRVPGTVNYKYSSTPRVRLLWEDGPRHKLRDIEKKLPPPRETSSDGEGAAAVYKRLEKRIPAWARTELMKGKASVGKRSEVLWKLECALLEAGVTFDDAFILIKASPWNKFVGRRGEDDQLRRELSKVYEKKLGGGGKSKAAVIVNGEDSDYHFLATSMEDVEEEDIHWLWYPYLARREVTIIEGDPGVGKSYLAQMVGKALVDGDRLPSTRDYRAVKGRVAYFDVENTAGSVTKKRLKYNGCDNLNWFYQEEEPFTVDDADKTEHVYDAIEKLRPVAVFFDTINLYIGKADTATGNQTTQALGTFKDIARRFNCAVVILRHLTKGNSKEKALYRGQGNIAFAGVARIVMTVGTDPEDSETRVVSITKTNLARLPKALTFTIDAAPSLKDPDRSRFKWGDFVDLTSDDILGVSKNGVSSREEAEKFLRDALEDGPVELKALEVMAEKRSLNMRTVKRAAEIIEVVREQRGFGTQKTSFWSL